MTSPAEPINFVRTASEMAEPFSRASQSTSEIVYESEGHCLIIGQPEPALAAASRLVGLSLTLVTIDAGLSKLDKQLTDTGLALYSAVELRLDGYLGAFNAVAVSGESSLDLAVSQAIESGSFDLVLDLSATPLLRQRLAPFGYLHAPDDDALEAAIQNLPELIGDFSKPRYFQYDAALCAHSRSELAGCQRCLDVCVTGAISSDGEGVSVDPFLCQGCGSCATLCPTGAMIYAYPKPAEAITRTRDLIKALDTPASVLILHTEASQAVLDSVELPAHCLPLLVEEVSAFGIDYWATQLCGGIRQIVLVTDASDDDPNRLALQEQATLLHTFLQGLGVNSEVVILTRSETLATLVHESSVSSELADVPVQHFSTHNDKRQTLRMALDWLSEHKPPIQAVQELPAVSPFGHITVNKLACTLCMACVSTCPSKALLDGQDTPALRMIEANCVQCGLCETACPESAISLEARYTWDSIEARSIKTLNEEAPFNCVTCHKPFATRKMIDTMLEKLGGHWMFKDEKSMRRLKMCEDCRVKSIFADNPDGLDVHDK